MNKDLELTNESRVIELIIRQSWHITLNPPLSFIIPKKKHKCKLSQDIKPIQLSWKDNTGFSYGPYNINNTHKRDLMTSIMTLTISRHTWEEIDHMTWNWSNASRDTRMSLIPFPFPSSLPSFFVGDLGVLNPGCVYNDCP